MAESKQIMEDDLTCSICMEMFREPVMLPCQHNFCRGCIGLFADKSNSGQSDEDPRKAGTEAVQPLISCPVCRAPIRLGKDAVAGLPINAQMAEMVERFVEVTVEDNTPSCSVCEEETPAKAVKFCSTCCLLYCKDCLASLHPMRGGLARHSLIPVEEYLSQETSAQDQSCERHGHPLIIYCVTCHHVICVGCLGEHPLHTTRDVQSATEEDKATFTSKSDLLEKAITELKQILSNFKALQTNIQKNQDLHLKDVERAYCAAIHVLTSWRNDSTEAVKTRHTEWSTQCTAVVKSLEMQLEEMERVQQSSQDLWSLTEVQILQVSKQLSKRIDDQLSEVKTSNKKWEEVKRSLTESVHSYPVDPRRVMVTEEAAEQRVMRRLNITIPNLVFAKTVGFGLLINRNGSQVQCGDLTSEGTSTAFTDGRYLSGRYYWEITITTLSSTGLFGSYCRVGVAEETYDVKRCKPGRDSLYVRMQYSAGKVRCSTECGGEMNPAYQEWRPCTGPQHLGLYLDCDGRSLTVLDRDRNELIYTVTGFVPKEPVVPIVRFSGVKSGCARLVTGSSVSLPRVLCHMLNSC